MSPSDCPKTIPKELISVEECYLFYKNESIQCQGIMQSVSEIDDEVRHVRSHIRRYHFIDIILDINDIDFHVVT